MTVVSVESERFESMEEVAELDLHGLNPTQISKKTGIQRKIVLELLADYRSALQNDAEARDLARDHLNKMVKHYDTLIKKFYDLCDELETLNFNDRVAAQKNAALKAIAELELKRVDSLRNAGLLESAELGNEIAKWEEEKETLLSVLRDLCPICRSKVGARIAKLNGKEVAEYDDTIDVEVIT